MKNNVLCVMVLGTLLLVGCGSKNDANEKNLSDATNAYLVKKGQLCLGIASKWPVDLQESDRGQGHRQRIGNGRLGENWLGAFPRDGNRIHAFVRYRPVKAKVLRYELTEDGKKFYQRKGTPRFDWREGKSRRHLLWAASAGHSYQNRGADYCRR